MGRRSFFSWHISLSWAGLAPAAGDVSDEPVGADLLYFQRYLATDLHKKCASCHSDPESAGRYLLAPLDDLTRRTASWC